MESEGWVECMHPRGFLFGILVEIIIFVFTTRLTCLTYPSPLLMKQVRQACRHAGMQACRGAAEAQQGCRVQGRSGSGMQRCRDAEVKAQGVQA